MFAATVARRVLATSLSRGVAVVAQQAQCSSQQTVAAVTRRCFAVQATPCCGCSTSGSGSGSGSDGSSRPGTSEETAAWVVKARDTELRTKHGAVAAQATPGLKDSVEMYRKRCIYRSKQRGWLEVDLLLGTFATRHVPDMTLEQLREYEAIINCETIDIFNYVTKKDEPPPELNTAVLKQLQEFADSHPFGKASVEGYAAVKPLMSN